MNKNAHHFMIEILKTIASVMAGIAMLISVTFVLFIAPEPIADVFTFIGLVVAGTCSLIIATDKLKVALARDKQKSAKKQNVVSATRRTKYKNPDYGFASKV